MSLPWLPGLIVLTLLSPSTNSLADPGLVLGPSVLSAMGAAERSGNVALCATLGETAVGRSGVGDLLESAGFWRADGLFAAAVAPEPWADVGSLKFGLLPNAPNPLNSTTLLRYSLPHGLGNAEVSIRILDVSGRLVRRLDPGVQGPGPHVIDWDGRTDSRVPVGAGIYFCSLCAGPFRATRKLVVIH